MEDGTTISLTSSVFLPQPRVLRLVVADEFQGLGPGVY